jgi:CDP-diglyceride synthetase
LEDAPMPAARSPAAQLAGTWIMAAALPIAAILIGRLIGNYPQLLPNRLPGLVIHELAPGLLLALAIGAGLALTARTGKSPRFAIRLAILLTVALTAGVGSLLYEFGHILYP